MVAPIDRASLQALLGRGGVVLVEALGPMYYADAHLPGALNIPLDRIDVLAHELLVDHDAVIVVYCSDRSSRNSQVVARRLEALGYRDVRHYSGGKQDWVEHGLPVERPPSTPSGGGGAPRRKLAT